jgi:hypothetical protein
MYKYVILSILLFNFSCSKSNKEREAKEQSDNSVMEKINESGERVNFSNGLSLTLPNDWTIKDTLNSNTFAYLAKCEDSVVFCSNLVVRFINNENNLTLGQVVDYFLTSLPDRFETLKIVSVREHEINGITLTVVDYKMNESNTDLGSTCAFFLMNEQIISFYFTGKNQPEGSYLEEREIMVEILKSLNSDSV